MSDLLKYAKESDLFNSIDYHFAKTFAPNNVQHQLVALLVSHAYGMKHTMVPYSFFEDAKNWFTNITLQEAERYSTQLQSLASITNQNDWQMTFDSLKQLTNSPLSITDAGIYLTKNLSFEKSIVHFLQSNQFDESTQLSEQTVELLHTLFPSSTNIDKQKLAAVNALLSPVSIISGGPGTGKTTTVIKILLLLLNEHPDLHISLAAPTGKAAARLSESIEKQKTTFKINNPELANLLDKIPSSSTTLHRLLSFNPNQIRPRYHPYHPLPTDLIIIDEASMIDLDIFNLFIQALPKHVRVIILGDKDQLASVEAGAIMSEVCQNIGYNKAHLTALENIMGQSLAEEFEPKQVPLNNVTLLTQSHRFSADSGIGQLAKVINQKNASAFESTVQKFSDELSFINSRDEPWHDAIHLLLKDYVTACQHNEPIQKLFELLHQFRILCATNVSEFGTKAINEYISTQLFKPKNEQLYHGQAIMILQNDYVNNIFNGDIGIIIQDEQRITAYFESDNGELRLIPVQLLPHYETAFAMTIHKSQGSEFDHVMIILPDFQSQILTKELLYTGVTRAKRQLTIVGSIYTIKQTIQRSTERFSGISYQLNLNI